MDYAYVYSQEKSVEIMGWSKFLIFNYFGF